MKNRKSYSLFQDNRGVSLVEVLVVMAILTILTTISVSSLNYVIRGDIKKATKTLYSAIASNRTYSMAKPGRWTFNVFTDAEGVYQYQSVKLEEKDGSGVVTSPEIIYDEEKFSNRVDFIRVCIYGANESLIADYSDLVSIVFKKNTGAVDSITTTGNVYKASDNPGGFADIMIDIAGNNRILRLYFLTGEIEQKNY